jgi:hypothetical protein
MTYHWACNKSNTTGAICGAGTDSLPRHMCSLLVRVARSSVFCVVFCRLLLILLYLFFWSLCYLFFFVLRLLITTLVSFGYCVVSSSLLYGFWLPLWYLLAIVLSVRLSFTASDYRFGIFWSLCCLFFFALRLLITALVSFGHCDFYSSLLYGFWLPLWYLLDIVLSVLCFTASDYRFGDQIKQNRLKQLEQFFFFITKAEIIHVHVVWTSNI